MDSIFPPGGRFDLDAESSRRRRRQGEMGAETEQRSVAESTRMIEPSRNAQMVR